MSYEAALNKAWTDLANLKPPNNLSVKFLADTYTLDLEAKRIFSESCNVAAKDFLAILLLHYLAQKLKGVKSLNGEWFTFRELSGVEGYYDAFYRRSIEPLTRKYGKNPDAIKDILNRLPARQSTGADISIEIEAFEGVPVLIKLWKADEEFAPQANMYFDSSIKNIFCTEDIVVLSQMVASQL